MNLNQRLNQNTGRVEADLDKVKLNARQYHEYYIVETDLAYAVYGALADNVALYMGSYYNPEAAIDRFRQDNE